jgi:hypothetical protein
MSPPAAAARASALTGRAALAAATGRRPNGRPSPGAAAAALGGASGASGGAPGASSPRRSSTQDSESSSHWARRSTFCTSSWGREKGSVVSL